MSGDESAPRARRVGDVIEIRSSDGSIRSMPSPVSELRQLGRFVLADGTEKIARSPKKRQYKVGDERIFPMNAEGMAETGWRHVWRVAAVDALAEPGSDVVVTFEYERPATPRSDVEAED